ncbi:MAG TPA: hypothetical protein VI932_09215 [Bacteroidota bacterium]|nr:hypothetical protein [Bacteroidota bacterium]
MRLLQYLAYAILGFIIWKIVKLFISMRNSGGRYKGPPVDIPPDHSYKNIEDADFEDVTGDSDKPS